MWSTSKACSKKWTREMRVVHLIYLHNLKSAKDPPQRGSYTVTSTQKLTRLVEARLQLVGVFAQVVHVFLEFFRLSHVPPRGAAIARVAPRRLVFGHELLPRIFTLVVLNDARVRLAPRVRGRASRAWTRARVFVVAEALLAGLEGVAVARPTVGVGG